ncbi:probable fatty acid-binding protein [Contarinia nasturtii]|uniref:probable fatty acid-binding protein n=1 Tax=Contarinia nasturtii TaxID=265458 RepID=UPI0012D4175D|nr:probable fatty acid-binding protein [Contarinia nasturtii]
MPEVWEGKAYKMTESENFDEYMKALGVGFVLRKIGNSVTPTVELKKDGDTYTLVTSSTFKTSTISFKLGEEFDEETLDGRKVKSVITLDGNKLVQKQGGTPPSDIIREFDGNNMVATMTVGEVTCTRKYAAPE